MNPSDAGREEARCRVTRASRGRRRGPMLLLSLLAAVGLAVWSLWQISQLQTRQRELRDRDAAARDELALLQKQQARLIEDASERARRSDALSEEHARLQAELARQQALRLSAVAEAISDTRPGTALRLLDLALQITDAMSVRVQQRALDLLAVTGGQSLGRHIGRVTAAVLVDDGRLAVTGDVQGELRVWDLADDQPARPRHVLTQHAGRIESLIAMPRTTNGSASAHAEDHDHDVPQVDEVQNRRIISGSADTTIRIWDLDSVDPGRFSRVLRGHHGAVTHLCLSDDGRILVSAGRDHAVRVWEIADLETAPGSRLLSRHTDEIVGLVMTTDASRICSIDRTGTIRVSGLDSQTDVSWDEGAESAPTAAALSPDGGLLCVGRRDGSLRLYPLHARLSDPPEAMTVITGHAGPLTRLVFDRAGAWLASSDAAGVIQVWAVNPDGSLDRQQSLRGSQTHVAQLQFVSAKTVHGRDASDALLVAGADRHIRLWSKRDWTEFTPLPRTLGGHEAFITTIATSQHLDNSAVAVSGDAAGGVRRFRLGKPVPACLPECLVMMPHAVEELIEVGARDAPNPDHARFVIRDRSGYSVLCGIRRNAIVGESHGDGSARRPDATSEAVGVMPGADVTPLTSQGVVAMSRGGRLCARWRPDAENRSQIDVMEFSAASPQGISPQVIGRLRLPSAETHVLAMAFTPDGESLAVSVRGGKVLNYSLERAPSDADASADGLASVRVFSGAFEDVAILEFGSAGRLLAGRGWGSSAAAWSVRETGPSPTRLLVGHGGPITSLAFSPHEDSLIWTGSRDGTVREWRIDLAAGDSDDGMTPEILEARRVLRTPTAGVLCLCLLRDGRWLAGGTQDGRIRVWDVSESMDREGADGPIQLVGHAGAVSELIPGAEQRWLYSRGADGSVLAWDLDTILPSETDSAEAVTVDRPTLALSDGVGPVTTMHPTDDGRWLLCGTAGGLVVRWPLHAEELRAMLRACAGSELTESERQEFEVP